MGRDLDKLETEASRAVIMVGVAAVGSVLLMFLIEKFF
jgi:hypothetical protein